MLKEDMAMSIPRKQVISCPHCHKEFPVTIWESVNTDLSPDLPERIISGKFFDAQCPNCGFVAHLQYDVLYHDMRHSAMIWVVHRTEGYDSRCAEIKEIRPLPGYHTRIVHDVVDLREKVAALESGKDDRVIELCKYYIAYTAQQQNPGFRVANAFYTRAGGTDFIFLYDKDGNELGCELEPAMYDLIEEQFHERLKRIPEEPNGIYDFEWAAAMFGVNHSVTADVSQASAATHPDDTGIVASSAPQKCFCHKCGAKLHKGD